MEIPALGVGTHKEVSKGRFQLPIPPGCPLYKDAKGWRAVLSSTTISGKEMLYICVMQ